MKRSAFKTGDITTKGREVISKANKAAKLAKLSSMTAANSPWVKALANKTLGVAGMVLDPISMGTKDDVQAIKEQENEAYRNQKNHDGISLYKETTDTSLFEIDNNPADSTEGFTILTNYDKVSTSYLPTTLTGDKYDWNTVVIKPASRFSCKSFIFKILSTESADLWIDSISIIYRVKGIK